MMKIIISFMIVILSAGFLYSYELTLQEQTEYNEWSNYIDGGTYYQTAEGEDLGWKEGPYLKGYIYGYLAFKETKWLDLLVQHADVLFSRLTREQDGKLGWYGPGMYDAPNRTDALVGEALIMEPITEFIHIVKKESLTSYTAKADSYLSIIEAELIPKRDARGDWQNSGTDAGVFRSAPFEDVARPLMSHPYNKCHEMGQVLINLYRITHKQYYKDKIMRLANRFKHNLKLTDGDQHNWWDYWDPAGPWDYKLDGSTQHWVGREHRSGYSNINMTFFQKCYKAGIVATKTDIERMVRNFKEKMWNGSTVTPQFALCDGSSMGVNDGTIITGMCDALIGYDATLLSLDWQLIDGNTWGGMVSLPYYFYVKWYGTGYELWNDPVDDITVTPAGTEVKMNVYPNPINKEDLGNSTVKFVCLTSSVFELSIFDSSANLLYKMPSGFTSGKNYNLSSGIAAWDGTTRDGSKCARGVYYYSIVDEGNNKKAGKFAVK